MALNSTHWTKGSISHKLQQHQDFAYDFIRTFLTTQFALIWFLDFTTWVFFIQNIFVTVTNLSYTVNPEVNKKLTFTQLLKHCIIPVVAK